jgi:hypothetical protein
VEAHSSGTAKGKFELKNIASSGAHTNTDKHIHTFSAVWCLLSAICCLLITMTVTVGANTTVSGDTTLTSY